MKSFSDSLFSKIVIFPSQLSKWNGPRILENLNTFQYVELNSRKIKVKEKLRKFNTVLVQLLQCASSNEKWLGSFIDLQALLEIVPMPLKIKKKNFKKRKTNFCVYFLTKGTISFFSILFFLRNAYFPIVWSSFTLGWFVFWSN